MAVKRGFQLSGEKLDVSIEAKRGLLRQRKQSLETLAKFTLRYETWLRNRIPVRQQVFKYLNTKNNENQATRRFQEDLMAKFCSGCKPVKQFLLLKSLL